jgi:hypothetical protein
MKTIILIATMILCTPVFAQNQLTLPQIEAKARNAVALTLNQAIVNGNSWQQQIYSDIEKGADIKIQDDIATVYLQSGLCQITVLVDTQFGFVTAPVDAQCVEL